MKPTLYKIWLKNSGLFARKSASSFAVNAPASSATDSLNVLWGEAIERKVVKIILFYSKEMMPSLLMSREQLVSLNNKRKFCRRRCLTRWYPFLCPQVWCYEHRLSVPDARL